MAILAIAMILFVLTTLSAMTVARVGLFEQKMAGVDVRSKEVYAAATGGLEHGVKWFEEHYAELVWADTNGDGVVGAGDLAVAAPAIGVTKAQADDYVHELSYRLLTALSPSDSAMPIAVRISATARAQNDSHVSKSVSVDVMVGRVGLFHGGHVLDVPPLIVEECMAGAVGHATIHPNGGISIGSTAGDSSCIASGGFDLNGGGIVALAEPRSLSEAIFGLPSERDDDGRATGSRQAEILLRTVERREPRRVYVIDLDDGNNPPGQPSYSLQGGKWRTSLDDPDQRPYILFFTREAGCPEIADGVEIHGLVYYEDTRCTNHRWGQGAIHGTLAIAGSVSSLDAAVDIHGRLWDFGDPKDGDERKIRIGLAIPTFFQVPGSWKDF